MTRYAVLLAAAVALVVGCGDGWRSGVTPEQSRDQVRQALDEAWAQVKPHGLTASAASGGYTTCVDTGGSVVYEVDARINPTTSARPIVDKLQQPLTRAGWTVELKQDKPRVLRARKGDIVLRIHELTNKPFLLLDITGTCVEVGKDRDNDYLNASRVDNFTLM